MIVFIPLIRIDELEPPKGAWQRQNHVTQEITPQFQIPERSLEKHWAELSFGRKGPPGGPVVTGSSSALELLTASVSLSNLSDAASLLILQAGVILFSSFSSPRQQTFLKCHQGKWCN